MQYNKSSLDQKKKRALTPQTHDYCDHFLSLTIQMYHEKLVYILQIFIPKTITTTTTKHQYETKKRENLQDEKTKNTRALV
jgi:hypothetical protein